MAPSLPDELPPVNRRFATPEETTARLGRIESITDIVEDAGRTVEELGPRHRHPDRSPETIPSVSAVLIAMALLEVAAAVRLADARVTCRLDLLATPTNPTLTPSA